MSSHVTNNSTFGEGNRGLQVGANSGTIDVHFHLSHPESPAHVGSAAIPFRRNDDFVPRGDFLDIIDGICSRASGRVALIGFGGVGKSHLAIEYAYRIKERSDDPKNGDPKWVFWVHAANAHRVEQGFRDIATAVELPGRDAPDADIFSLVHDWLKKERKGKWLMVLDGADDVEIFTTSATGPGGPTLLDCIPWSRNGSVLITTRHRGVATKLGCTPGDLLHVGNMSENEGLHLLGRGIGVPENEGIVRQLVHVLDGNPLALSQAAAYIRHRRPRMSAVKYLERLQSERNMAALLEHVEDDPWRYSDPETSRSVLLTLHATFDKIKCERPSAASLLGFMSIFDGQMIADGTLRTWRTMTSSTAKEASFRDSGFMEPPTELDGNGCESMNDGFDEDMTLLCDYSLITATTADTFTMNRLVQLSVRRWCRDQGHFEKAQDSAICISSIANTFGFEDPTKMSWRRRLLDEACLDGGRGNDLCIASLHATKDGGLAKAVIVITQYLELFQPVCLSQEIAKAQSSSLAPCMIV